MLKRLEHQEEAAQVRKEDMDPEEEQLSGPKDTPFRQPEFSKSSSSKSKAAIPEFLAPRKKSPPRTPSKKSDRTVHEPGDRGSSTESVQSHSAESGSANPRKDPGALELIEAIRNVVVNANPDTDPENISQFALSMLIASPYWSESSLKNMHYELATHLLFHLVDAGVLHIDEDISSNDALVIFFRSVQDAKKRKASRKKAFSAGTKVENIAFQSQRATKGSKKKSTSDPKIQEHVFVDEDTGRLDSRGLPIFSRKRIAKREATGHEPPQNDPSSSSSSDTEESSDDEEVIPRFRKIRGKMKDMGGYPDPSDSSDSDAGSRKRNIKKDRPRKNRRNRREIDDEISRKDTAGMGVSSALKLAISLFSRYDSKWGGPRDRNFTTDEFVQHYQDVMEICEAPTRIRLAVIPFALKDDALDEYNQHFRALVKQKTYRNSSGILREIANRLETPEFKMENKNLWSTIRLSDIRKSGETIQLSFHRLKRKGRRLQKLLGREYSSDVMLCDFFRRALQDEPFWAYVDDADPNMTSEIMIGKIDLAIQRYSRLRKTEKDSRVTETMTTAIDQRRWGRPDRKRLSKIGEKRTNPKYKDGTIMRCTGCDSADHFYRDCKDPKKIENRKKKLQEIADMKASKQPKFLRSYFLQMSDDDDSTSHTTDTVESEEDDSEEDLNCAREVAEELSSSLTENMFLELNEDKNDGYETVFQECIKMQTCHNFFGEDPRGVESNRKRSTTVDKQPSTKLRYHDKWFPGIMIDNGSTGSLCSVTQLRAYRTFTGNPTPVRQLKNHYAISAHGGSKCIGIATFKFPYADSIIEFDAPIVEDSDLPLILGLNDQDRLLSSGANQQSDTICFFDGPPAPIIRDRGHMWLRWNYVTECLFTEKELVKLHYRFGHPGTRRMHDFLKRVKADELSKDTRGMLENIQARCKECQFLSPKPYVVKVAVPREDLIFNSEVVIDIMWIQGKHVLHVVDRETHFQAARFLTDDSTETIWRTFMEMWILVYLGAPDNLRHDQGTQFVSPRLQAMAAEAGITCRPVGVEAAHAMGVGERYHAPLRKTFLKLKETYGSQAVDEVVEDADKSDGKRRKPQKKMSKSTGVEDKFLLAIAVMCINTTVGPEGICPTLLVFGAMPKLPLPGSLPSAVPQAERMMMLETAREEYLRLIAKIRLKQAEKAFIPSSPPTTLEYGDKILVYRETTKRWEPRNFVSRNENTILVLEPNGEVQPYAITRVSEFKTGVYLPRPDLYGIVDETAEEIASPDRVPKPMGQEMEPESMENNEENPAQTNADDFGETPDFGPWSVGWKPSVERGDTDETMNIDIENEMKLELMCAVETNYTVVLKNNDERRKQFKEAIEKEVNGLFEKETFVSVRRWDFTTEDLNGLTILKAKLVLALKEMGTPEERKKARLVVQAIGNKDQDKRMLFTYSPTVTRASVRLILAIATRKKLSIFLRDISQAYVSTTTKLLREIYVIPPKELGLDKDIMWKVVRPLYGLPESGVIWFETYIAHHNKLLKMKSANTDPCLLYRFDNSDELCGIVCLQVDDSIGAGSPQFLNEEEAGSKKFQTRGKTILQDGMEIKFNGHCIKRDENIVTLHQREYINRMPSANVERTPSAFMSHRGEAMYVSSCTRIDVSCAVNQLAQTIAEDATEKEFKRLDDVFRRMKNEAFELKYGNVDLDTAEIHIFADASFATNKDLSSQLGYVILLVDTEGNCSVLSWTSVKCKRVTRSVLAAELYAVAHAFDAGFAISHTVSKMLNRKITIRVFTDSRTLFDSIITFCSMTEKRLLIDIACLRDSYRNGELTNLAWIRSQHNTADALTKDKSDSSLHDMLRTHRIKTPVEQWIDEGMIPPRRL